jgi:hypothetical protein
MDLFVVPTIGFDLLYAFVIVRLDRRDLVWINVTTNPTAEWVARQITEAFPWDGAPRHMIRDRDRIYGAIVTRRLRAMGTSLALAEWLCRTADRIDPTRVLGPRHCLGRGTFAQNSQILRRLLQQRQNASVFAQGRAGFPGCSAIRCDQFTRHPGRTSSPIRPCLSFSVHTGFVRRRDSNHRYAVLFAESVPVPKLVRKPATTNAGTMNRPATIQKVRFMRALFDGVRYPRALILGERALPDVRPHAAAKQQHCNAQSEQLPPGNFHFDAP